MTVQRPALGAFMLALVSGIALWLILYVVHASLTQGPAMAARQVPYLLMGVILFAAPIGVAVLLVLGGPAYLLLRLSGHITLPVVLTLGAVGGLLGRVAVVLLWGEPEATFVPLPVVVLAGIGAAMVWWTAWNSVDEHTMKGTI